MQNDPPSHKYQDLQTLVGIWSGTESCEGQSTSGTFEYRWVLDGQFLASTYQQCNEFGKLIFQGRGYYRALSGEDRFQMVWLDSRSSALMLEGYWIDGCWVYPNGPVRYIHQCDGHVYRFRIEKDPDRQILLSGEYRRHLGGLSS